MTQSLQGQLEQAQQETQSISCSQLSSLDKEKTVFIDVRTKEEYDAGHLEGAIHMDRGHLEFYVAKDSPNYHPIFNSDKTVVVYCQGGIRSLLAAKLMQDMGLKNILNLKEGYLGTL